MVKVLEIRSGKIREMEQRYADVLIRLGHVRIHKAPDQAPVAAPAPAAETAEPQPVAAMSGETAPELFTEKPKRAYKRRDMKAEGEE